MSDPQSVRETVREFVAGQCPPGRLRNRLLDFSMARDGNMSEWPDLSLALLYVCEYDRGHRDREELRSLIQAECQPPADAP